MTDTLCSLTPFFWWGGDASIFLCEQIVQCCGEMNEAHQLGEKKVASPDPSHEASHPGVFTVNEQLIARTRHLLKILRISKANRYR